jgi:hypothetical protein
MMSNIAINRTSSLSVLPHTPGNRTQTLGALFGYLLASLASSFTWSKACRGWLTYPRRSSDPPNSMDLGAWLPVCQRSLRSGCGTSSVIAGGRWSGGEEDPFT